MDYQEILVKEYIAYLESKDRFIERSFMINRFYMILVLLLFIAMFWFAEHSLMPFSPLVVSCAIAGMVMSLMWVLNQDSYAYLIKVKLSDVIEKMEQHLPIQPHVMEYEAMQTRKTEKRVMFVDVQKGVAFVSFIMFFGSFLFFSGYLYFPKLMKAWF